MKSPDPSLNDLQILNLVMTEFDHLVHALTEAGIEVIRIPGNHPRNTPDAVFPNNWFSTHLNSDGSKQLVLYPMEAKSRRDERRLDVIEILTSQFGIQSVVDLTHFETQKRFLEGTGSLVLDRKNKIAYAGLSSRTHREPLKEFASKLGYQTVTFEIRTQSGMPVYHTNVMLSVGETLAVVCLEAIPKFEQRFELLHSLRSTGREIIEISHSQMERFCANVLEVKNKAQNSVWVMSQTARSAFTPAQFDAFNKTGQILFSPIPWIERLGGGSVRCMLAELF